MSTLRIDSTNTATFTLTNGANGAYVNDADVEITVMDHVEQEVDGQAWPLTMPYVAASDGIYRVQLPAFLDLSQHSRYIVQVVAVSGALQLTVRQAAKAVYDDGDPSTE